jgi:6-phosphogluconate dehydrogenase
MPMNRTRESYQAARVEAMHEADTGMIGLGVMGSNLVLNMAGKGIRAAVYDHDPEAASRLRKAMPKDKGIFAASSYAELIANVKKPRRIMIMVGAGSAIDDIIEGLLPHLEKGDAIIDGGNSHFSDTIRRTRYVESKGLWYIGAGISGGREGALKGPCIMPGGSHEAWPLMRPIFEAIAAKADGRTCCVWMGGDGAGHYVKMVHNGIEYALMQLISEAYQIMKDGLGLPAGEIAEIFARWNAGRLEGYLTGITAKILAFRDNDGMPLVDRILDAAEEKGTGRWAVEASMEAGVPFPMTAEAVYARSLSAMKEERMAASHLFKGPGQRFKGDPKALIDDIEQALIASSIIAFAQGFALLRSASRTYRWTIHPAQTAHLWRGGCIIRCALLEKAAAAFEKDPDLPNLITDPFFAEAMESAQQSWRRMVTAAMLHGIPVPAFASSLCYFDAYRCGRLPANLIQAQRDYFGAHTYERTDRPRGEYFHTDWRKEDET